MNNQSIEVHSVEQFDQLTEPEKLITQITHFRLHLYNAGLSCGPKAIRKELQEQGISSAPSASTIARALSRQHLTAGRMGFYAEDYIKSEEGT